MKPADGQILGAENPGDDDPLIDDHSCTCGGCAESLANLPPDRQGDQHASVRFGDNARRPSVLLNGAAIEDRCFEAIAGDPGRAWCFRPNDWGKIWHQCRTCGQGACIEVKTGRVEVIWGA
jgi:hypothetical protein